MKDTYEYKLISEIYGNTKAKRSDVPYINHIDEGLIILDIIGASTESKKAYCVHPLFQSDGDLLIAYTEGNWYGINANIILLAMEYRSVANEFLSIVKPTSTSDIRLSPLKDVNDMLIADKIQNRKDFNLYHKGKHPRSNELDLYFSLWLYRLGIGIERYQEIIKKLV